MSKRGFQEFEEDGYSPAESSTVGSNTIPLDPSALREHTDLTIDSTFTTPFNPFITPINNNETFLTEAVSTDNLEFAVFDPANYSTHEHVAARDSGEVDGIGQNDWNNIDDLFPEINLKYSNFDSNLDESAWDQNMGTGLEQLQPLQVEGLASQPFPHGLPTVLSTSTGNVEGLQSIQSNIGVQAEDNMTGLKSSFNETEDGIYIESPRWPTANNPSSPHHPFENYQNPPDPNPSDPNPSLDIDTDDPMPFYYQHLINIYGLQNLQPARMHLQYSTMSPVDPSNPFPNYMSASPNFTAGSPSPAPTNNTMGSPAVSNPARQQRGVKQAPRDCPTCPKRFIPSDKNGGLRCTRCQKKHERAERGPKVYTLDLSVPNFDAARDVVYPHLPRLNIPNDDVYDWVNRQDSENISIGRLLDAVTTVYVVPPPSSPTYDPAVIAQEDHSPEDAARTSSDPAPLNSGEVRDMSQFYLRQQDFFNKKNFDNHTVNVRLRMLYRAMLTYHGGGPSVYPTGGDNAGYNTRDMTSKFSIRFAAIENVLRLDKRVVSDVIEGRGVCALVQDPWGYERRKTDNETSNRKKKGLHNLGKGVQAQTVQQNGGENNENAHQNAHNHGHGERDGQAEGDGDDELDDMPLSSRAQGQRPRP